MTSFNYFNIWILSLSSYKINSRFLEMFYRMPRRKSVYMSSVPWQRTRKIKMLFKQRFLSKSSIQGMQMWKFKRFFKAINEMLRWRRKVLRSAEERIKKEIQSCPCIVKSCIFEVLVTVDHFTLCLFKS